MGTNAYAYPVSHHNPPNSPTRARGRMRTNTQTYRNGLPSCSSGGSDYYYHDQPIQPACVMRTLCGPTGPTNHVLVPQREFKEEYMTPLYTDPHFRYPPVTFQTVGNPEIGVKVENIAETHEPSIVGANDAVFASYGDREVRVWILVCPHRV